MLKVVVDSNVYISAIFWGGRPRQVIDLGRDNKIKIFTSENINQEIFDKLKTKFSLSSDEAENIMTDFSSFTNPIEIDNHVYVVKDDPDDDKFVECALECSASFIISGDKHLLKLKNYEHIKIVNAASFLQNWDI